MMSRSIRLFITVLLLAGFTFAAKITTFDELQKPDSIHVDKDRIFITEGTTIFIYSSGDFTLVKTFGQKGEGPREFLPNRAVRAGMLQLAVRPDEILVNSFRKLSFFTREGVFKKEIRMTTPGFGMYKGIGKQYVGYGLAQYDKTPYLTINFYDEKLGKVKEIFKYKIPGMDGKTIDPINMTKGPVLISNDERVCFNNGFNDIIYIFDQNGKEVSRVKLENSRIMLTKDREARYMKYFKSPAFPFHRDFERDRDRVKFPDYFPAIRNFTAAENLYVLTYKEDGKYREMLVVDFNGKILKKLMLPVAENDPLHLYPYTVKNGKLYQLVDNIDTEEWELHVTPVK